MTFIPKARTIIEPFKIKMIEPLPILTYERRLAAISNADYNTFKLEAFDVSFDFLTDSGTSAMSAAQWAGIMIGDESYAGSKSFKNFERVVASLTSMEHVIPTHQGRSAEYLLMKAMVKPGQVVIGNTHFDTTRANIEMSGAIALDMPCPESKNSQEFAPFKGNLDNDELKKYLAQNRHKVAMIITTITNNSVGGQPVSLDNIRETSAICKMHGIPFFLDVARFAENAMFIKQREKGWEKHSVRKIAEEMFLLADGAMMSSKKDAFANIGGFLAMKDQALAQEIRTLMVVTEGFPTYGGLAGRDLEALAIGLQEILDEDYLSYRLRSVEYFGQGMENAGFKVVKPFGGHAVYIDAKETLPHLPWYQFPGQSLSVALYEYIGVRGVEVGSVMLGSKDPVTREERPAPKELVRLAMPRRVYTQSHIDYIIEMSQYLAKDLDALPGYGFVYEAPMLRHFTAKFKKLPK